MPNIETNAKGSHLTSWKQIEKKLKKSWEKVEKMLKKLRKNWEKIEKNMKNFLKKMRKKNLRNIWRRKKLNKNLGEKLRKSWIKVEYLKKKKNWKNLRKTWEKFEEKSGELEFSFQLKRKFVFILAAEIIQVLDSIPWVRCASGNVFSTFS